MIPAAARIVLRRPRPEPDDERYRAWKRDAVLPLDPGFVAVRVAGLRPGAVAKAAVLYADGRVHDGLELRWVAKENLPALYARLTS